MRIRSLLFVSSLAFAFSVASAAEAGANGKRLADELVRMLVSPESYKNMLQQMTDNMLPAMQAQSGGQLPADAGKKLTAAVQDALPYEELIGWSAEVYAAKFTEGELKELIAFYKTPVGRKVAKLMPELMGETGKKMAEIMPSRLPQALKKHGLVP